MLRSSMFLVAAAIIMGPGVLLSAEPPGEKDIRDFTHHFNTPGSMGPWVFNSPRGMSLSTTTFPGSLEITLNEPYEELKGTLGRPIPLSEFPIGWECEMEVLFDSFTTGGRDAAIGMNLAVTFSDPSTWSAKPNQTPPETYFLQTLLVHLADPKAMRGPGQKSMIWSRGTLDPSGAILGDWGVPTYNDVGDGQHHGGPANTATYLTARVESPTRIAIGVRFEQFTARNYRYIDVSSFGNITGIWEIGPVVPTSSWIKEQWPDAHRLSDARAHVGFIDFRYPHIPAMIPPGQIEHLSRDFNIPGYIGPWQFEFQGAYFETWSHPGYLTVTLRGIRNGAGGGGGDFRFTTFPPPWELEVCVIPPGDDCYWNLAQNFSVFSAMPASQIGPTGDSAGDISAWCPGVAYVPGKGHIAGNIGMGPGVMNVDGHLPHSFDKPLNWNLEGGFGPGFINGIPESILSSRPLYILCRVIDTKLLQMGVKAKPEDEWFLTPVWESPREMAGFGQQAWTMTVHPGAHDYHQFRFDYWHFRNGISGPLKNSSNRHIQ